MLDFFKLFKKNEKSKNIAKDRLKLVLVHDRAGCSPSLLEELKDELMQVLKKYMDVTSEDFAFELTEVLGEDGKVPALIANIPIKNMKEKALT